VNPSNYLKIKNHIPSNVNILAVSKGFKSQEIKTIQKIGQNDFGESKFQEAFEKQLILKDLKQIKWHFIGRIQSNKIRKIVQNFKYIHSVDSFEKLQKISSISYEDTKVLPKEVPEKWYSPIDRSLRRELKAKELIYWFDTRSYKNLIDLKIKFSEK